MNDGFRQGFQNAQVMNDYVGNIQRSYEEGRRRKMEDNMRELTATYFGGRVAPERMNDFLADVARNGGDPRAFQADMESGKARLRSHLAQGATFLLAAQTPEARAQAYATLRPQLEPVTREFGVELPEAWDESLMGEVQTIASTLGGGGPEYKPMNVSPGGEIVDPYSGRVIHANQNFRPQNPTWDSARGGWAMPPNQDTAPRGGLASLTGQPMGGNASPGLSGLAALASSAPTPAPSEGQIRSGMSGGGFLQVAPPRPNYEAERMDLARQAGERADQAAADARAARERSTWGNAPAGYRFNASGNLERIPGGPQEAGRALPPNVVTKLTKQASVYDNNADLLSSFDDGFAGNVIGGGLENFAGRVGGERVGIATKGQADWWQQYDRQKNIVRNELFGSALTPSEQKAFEAADINPNMDPARIRANLRMQQQIIERGLARQAQVWRAQGYNVDAIAAATTPSAPTGAAPGAPQQTQPQQMAKEGDVVENDQGVRLQLRGGEWVRVK